MKGYRVDPVRAAQARLAIEGEDGKPLKQVDAARLLDVHAITLNRIENGRAKVSRDLLDRMTELYGRSSEWLCGEPEPIDEIRLAREALADSVVAVEQSAGRLADLMDVLEGRLRATIAEQPVEQTG